MAKSDKKRKSASTLVPQVEMITSGDVEPEATEEARQDTLDGDVQSYIESFLTELPEKVKLEKFSIATPEEAKAALVVLNETMQRLNQQLSTARALQRLVLTNQGE